MDVEEKVEYEPYWFDGGELEKSCLPWNSAIPVIIPAAALR